MRVRKAEDESFRVGDVRWMLYRQVCRWQVGDPDGRWVAVAIIGAVELAWLSLAWSLLEAYEVVPKLHLADWKIWWISGAMYPLNWWLVVPRSGFAEFEARSRDWSAAMKKAEVGLALVLGPGIVPVVIILKEVFGLFRG